MKLHNYKRFVVDAVINYHKENYNQELTEYEVCLMHPSDVLQQYLNWEGIIGYAWIIEHILIDHEVEEVKD